MLPSNPFVIILLIVLNPLCSVLLQQLHLQITVAGMLGSFSLGRIHSQVIQPVSRNHRSNIASYPEDIMGTAAGVRSDRLLTIT
jgi:hypothetical protein